MKSGNCAMLSAPVCGMVLCGSILFSGGCSGPDPMPYARIPSAVSMEQQQRLKPGEECTVDLGGGVNLVLVWCPAGTFMIGSPPAGNRNEPFYEVTLTRGFWMGKCEVTRGQWGHIMKQTPCSGNERNLPVTSVSWNDCGKFIRKLNTLVAGGGFRLPTEAEWEYACQTGTNGVSAASLDEMEWYACGIAGHPVGLKKPNDWGLHDMRGNVSEWCWDGFSVFPPTGGVTNPVSIGPPPNNGRIIRGGNVCMPANGCRPAVRCCNFFDDRLPHVGFRIVRELL